MKNILLTGSSGFIGRNLYEQLRSFYRIFSPAHKELDLLNQKKVRNYIKENKIDIVLHSANTNDFKHSGITDYEVLHRNLRMFYNLENCKDLYEKMIYFGSGAEYNRNFYVPLMREDYFGKHIPEDAYGFSKYTMTRIADNSENIYNMRLFGVFGKYEEWERRFISNNICNLLDSQRMTINQNMYFDYLYIDDLVKIVRLFLERKPQHHVYNVCTGKRVTLYSLTELIKDVACIDCEIVVRQEGMKREYTGDNERLKNEFGQIEFLDIKAAIEKLYCYYERMKNNRQGKWSNEHIYYGRNWN